MVLYQRIADELAKEIKRGRYSAGERLPPESEMMRRFGVGVNTVKRAMAELRLQGLVETHRGLGTVVLAQDPQTALAFDLASIRGEPRPSIQDRRDAAALAARGWRRIQQPGWRPRRPAHTFDT